MENMENKEDFYVVGDVGTPPENPISTEPPGDAGLGQFIDIEPAVATASKEIRAGMERLKSDFWAGVLSGVVGILALRYVLEGKL